MAHNPSQQLRPPPSSSPARLRPPSDHSPFPASPPPATTLHSAQPFFNRRSSHDRYIVIGTPQYRTGYQGVPALKHEIWCPIKDQAHIISLIMVYIHTICVAHKYKDANHNSILIGYKRALGARRLYYLAQFCLLPLYYYWVISYLLFLDRVFLDLLWKRKKVSSTASLRRWHRNESKTNSLPWQPIRSVKDELSTMTANTALP